MKCKRHNPEIPMLELRSFNITVGYVCLFCRTFTFEYEEIHLDVLREMQKRQIQKA